VAGSHKQARFARLAVVGLAFLLTLGGLLWLWGRWAGTPAAVPDHATVFSGTQPMLFAGSGALGQRIVPRRDRLTAIDVLLSAEEPGLAGDVELELRERGSGEQLRRARVPAATLPAGSIWNLRPAQPSEQWTTFGFEPVERSAGRDLLFVLRYPTGVDQPGMRVATLAHLPGTYVAPLLLVNGAEHKGNLLFRLSSAGTRGAALGAGLDNLAGAQPVLAGTLVAPAMLLACCVVCAVAFAYQVAVYPFGTRSR
jgi:hypothetical protein